MDKHLKEFFESNEGKEWLKLDETSHFLYNLKNHIQDNVPSSKNYIKYLMKFFPEFVYQGQAYRFISQNKDEIKFLTWDSSFDNFSWSLNPEVHKEVLGSISEKNHLVKVYKANVKGLDLKNFISCLQEYVPELKMLGGYVERELEILVIEYNDLELHEVIDY